MAVRPAKKTSQRLGQSNTPAVLAIAFLPVVLLLTGPVRRGLAAPQSRIVSDRPDTTGDAPRRWPRLPFILGSALPASLPIVTIAGLVS